MITVLLTIRTNSSSSNRPGNNLQTYDFAYVKHGEMVVRVNGKNARFRSYRCDGPTAGFGEYTNCRVRRQICRYLRAKNEYETR